MLVKYLLPTDLGLSLLNAYGNVDRVCVCRFTQRHLEKEPEPLDNELLQLIVQHLRASGMLAVNALLMFHRDGQDSRRGSKCSRR